MAKVTRVLALLAVMTLVAALPMSVLAQNDAPHLFIGAAVVNGLRAATGTPITAWDGDSQIGSTKVTTGGEFTILVGRSSGRITFKIDNLDADQSHPAWEFGGLETGFNLTADGQSFQGPAAQDAAQGAAQETPSGQLGSSTWVIGGSVGAGLALLVFVAAFLWRKRLMKRQSTQ